MARRQKLVDKSAAGDDRKHSQSRFRQAAAALLGAIIVYLAYYPSDSVLVERGDALVFSLLALAFAGLASLGSDDLVHPQQIRLESSALDLVAGGLAAWMMLSAVVTAPLGNLRAATNEAWLWIGGAALFCALRRIGYEASVGKVCVVSMLAVASGLAVHGLHQQWVTLPEHRAAFERDPDAVLSAAGIDAPLGSAERAIFAGRLYDGGPSATFALANSLAGCLLAGVLLSSGLIALTYRRQSWQALVTLLSVAVICGTCLGFTHSRTAVIALGFGWLVLGVGPRLAALLRRPRRSMMALLAVLVLTVLGCGLIWWDARLLAIAPSSLEFRFQYWRATMAMVFEHPLFGVGPGNFQAVYQQYRDVSTSEQIAEPHNFLFETIASGGVLAGLLLLGLFGWGLRVGLSTGGDAGPFVAGNDDSPAQPADSPAQPADSPAQPLDGFRWIGIGAALALLLVWGIGLATRETPDVAAGLFALPLAIAVAALTAGALRSLPSQLVSRLLVAVLAGLLLHLSTSGGWTVPGLALWVWLAAGLLTPLQKSATVNVGRQRANRMAAAGCAAAMLLLYLMSWVPTTAARHHLEVAAAAMERGLSAKAERSLQAAMEADRWSPDACLALADLKHWQLIASDQQSLRRQWESLLASAKELAGRDPALYRAIGVQQLHLYQRHGDRTDLEAAAETFAEAARLSPADQWLAAQLAAISAAMDRPRAATDWARRAVQLAQLGINVEREFEFQLIYPARHLGPEVIHGPSRRKAPAVLSEAGILPEP